MIVCKSPMRRPIVHDPLWRFRPTALLGLGCRATLAETYKKGREMDKSSLRQKIARLDGSGYKAYGQLKGTYAFPRFELFIDHVQADPFAAPSRLRARVRQEVAAFDPVLFAGRVRRVALEDFIARAFAAAIGRLVRGRRGTGKSGFIGIDSGGQEILERTAAAVSADHVEVRFRAGLPAEGRRCLGKEAAAMLLEEVPAVVEAALMAGSLDTEAIVAHVNAAEDQSWLRQRLPELGLVAFVADGAVLPRASGVSDHPLQGGRIIGFQSPRELCVEVELPHGGRVTGMGIPEGVTLIVGGGYHGKSTLLRALERSVYAHIPGDGRELVVTRSDAVKIRAEDGRRVEKVNISPFISNLPFGIDTNAFSTDNASGSTSQAANIVEALEAGSRLLLIDEDTSATNFMIRDEMMRQLITRDREPITPFIDQVRNLFREHGVSTVLVMGGSGDYFAAADTVIAMDSYRPEVVTRQAQELAAGRRQPDAAAGFGPLTARAPLARGIDPYRGSRLKVSARGLDSLVFGKQDVDLSFVEQLVDPSQTRAIGALLLRGRQRGHFNGETVTAAALDHLFADIEQEGLDILAGEKDFAGAHPGDFARPRPHEVAAALNRLRNLEMACGAFDKMPPAR